MQSFGCGEQHEANLNVPYPYFFHMLLKVGTYNPLSLSRQYRLEQIIDELDCDILALSGTGTKQYVGEYSNWEISGNIITSFGWDSKQEFSNKSAGVAIVLGPRLRGARIVEIKHAPKSVQGRGGLIRIKKGNELDITAVVIYPPPICGDKDAKKRALQAAKITVMWAHRQVNTAKSRTLPLLLGDTQQRFGMTDGVRWPGHGEHWLQERGKLEIDKIWETFSTRKTSRT